MKTSYALGYDFRFNVTITIVIAVNLQPIVQNFGLIINIIESDSIQKFFIDFSTIFFN